MSVDKVREIGLINFFCDDLNRTLCINDYLKELLLKLWDEAEGFSGKRPFGNSGWESDLHIPLIKNGLIEGELDEDGYIQDCDSDKGDRIITEVIKAL